MGAHLLLQQTPDNQTPRQQTVPQLTSPLSRTEAAVAELERFYAQVRCMERSAVTCRVLSRVVAAVFCVEMASVV